MEVNELYARNVILTNTVYSRPTVWISEFLVIKYCGVSVRYLAKARTLYKQSIPSTYKEIYPSGFLLGKHDKRSWRWGFVKNRYFYDLETIPDRKPTCYRLRLPSFWEIVSEIDSFNDLVKIAQGEKGVSLKPASGNMSSKVEQHCSDDDANYFIECGFRKSDVLRLIKVGAWVRFIKRVVKFGLYYGYGFFGLPEFFDYCRQKINKQRLPLLHSVDYYDLHIKIKELPDDPQELRSYIADSQI